MAIFVVETRPLSGAAPSAAAAGWSRPPVGHYVAANVSADAHGKCDAFDSPLVRLSCFRAFMYYRAAHPL